MLLWKEAQQEVRQHWFIDIYISAYILGDKKHEPSKLNYYSFSDELTPLGMHSLEFPLVNGCCVRKLTILGEKLSTHDQIEQNDFYRTMEDQEYRSAETDVASMPKRLPELSQKERWTTHY